MSCKGDHAQNVFIKHLGLFSLSEWILWQVLFGSISWCCAIEFRNSCPVSTKVFKSWIVNVRKRKSSMDLSKVMLSSVQHRYRGGIKDWKSLNSFVLFRWVARFKRYRVWYSQAWVGIVFWTRGFKADVVITIRNICPHEVAWSNRSMICVVRGSVHCGTACSGG